MSVFAGDRRHSCACDRRLAQQGLILVYSADAAALSGYSLHRTVAPPGAPAPRIHICPIVVGQCPQWRRQDLLRGATKQQLVCRSSPYYEDM